MGEAAEVKVRIVIDDAAQAVAERIGGHLHDVADHAKEGHHSFLEWNAALELAEKGVEGLKIAYEKLVEPVIEFGKEAFEAANEAEEASRRLAGSLAMVEPGVGMGDLIDQAEVLRDHLEDVAIESGTTTAVMTEAFATIAERSSMPVEKIQALSESMAEAGRVLPGGAASLSEGFANLEAGIIRARNPIVQLIVQTGLLHGNAKQVAAQMQKLAPEQQMELATTAIEKMADRARGMPLTFDQMKASILSMWQAVKEAGGAPILEAVMKLAGEARTWFMQNRQAIEEYARSVGDRMAQFVDFVGDVVKHVSALFADDATNAAGGLQSAMSSALDIWEEIRTNADAIVDTFGDYVSLFADILGEMKDLIALIPGLESLKSTKVAVPGTEGGATPMQIDWTPHMQRMWNDFKKAAENVDISPEKYKKAQQAFDDALKEANKDTAAADTAIDRFNKQMQAMHDAAEQNAPSHKAAMGALISPDDAIQLDQITKAIEIAHKNHSKKSAEFAVSVLLANEELAKNMIESGAIAKGAIQGLSADIASAIQDFASLSPGDKGKLTALQTAVSSQEAAYKKTLDGLKGGNGNVVMNGGQTFKIQQDFRDQDPDAVFFTFRRDVIRAAVSRGQSRMSGAFGA